MRTRISKSKTACALVLALLALSVFSSVPRAGAVGPTITVNPTNPLIGQVITVMGAGFPVSNGGTVWIDLNGNGMLDKIESAYSVHFQTSMTGSFVAFLPTFGLAMSTYTVFAQLPDGGSVVASTQINVQDPAVNAIQNAQSALSNQISSAQSALSTQISAVRTDLDNKLGTPKQGTSDTLFSLLYAIQSSISAGFAGLSAQISSLSTQLSSVQSDIDGRLGSGNTPDCSIPPCPTDTVFSLLYDIQGSVGSSAANISNTVNSDFSTLTSQITSVQADLDSKLGRPVQGETVFGDLQSINSNLPAVQKSLSNVQTSMGTPNPGETVFGDLQSIQTSLRSLTGLQTSINNLQTSLNKLSNTATVSSGTNTVTLGLSNPDCSPQSDGSELCEIPIPIQSSSVCTVTVTTDAAVHGTAIVAFFPGSLEINLSQSTNPWTTTAAAFGADLDLIIPANFDQNPTVTYTWAATCPAS